MSHHVTQPLRRRSPITRWRRSAADVLFTARGRRWLQVVAAGLVAFLATEAGVYAIGAIEPTHATSPAPEGVPAPPLVTVPPPPSMAAPSAETAEPETSTVIRPRTVQPRPVVPVPQPNWTVVTPAPAPTEAPVLPLPQRQEPLTPTTVPQDPVQTTEAPPQPRYTWEPAQRSQRPTRDRYDGFSQQRRWQDRELQQEQGLCVAGLCIGR